VVLDDVSDLEEFTSPVAGIAGTNTVGSRRVEAPSTERGIDRDAGVVVEDSLLLRVALVALMVFRWRAPRLALGRNSPRPRPAIRGNSFS